MCHSLLFGLLLGAFVARLAFRRRFHHAWHGGACAAWRGPSGDGRFGRFYDGVQGFERAGRSFNLGELVRDLELNARQQEEAQPVLTQLREQLGGSQLRLRGALAAVAAEGFDRARAESVVTDVAPEVRLQLLEGLEHLHDILIPEQREVLRARLQGQGATPNPWQGPSTLL